MLFPFKLQMNFILENYLQKNLPYDPNMVEPAQLCMHLQYPAKGRCRQKIPSGNQPARV